MRKSKKEALRTNKNQPYINQQLLNVITPSGISFENNHASVGEGEGKIYSISRYPSEVEYGWLADLINLPGAASVIEYRYSSADIMINAFNHRISELKSLLENQKKESERQITEHAIEDLTELINRISVKQEPVGYFNIMLHIVDGTEDLLNARIRKISGMVRTRECNLRFLKFRQEKAMLAMAPWGIPDAEVSNVGEHNMPMSTFAGGFPMAAAGLNDAGGYYIGKSKERIVRINLWVRAKDRTNSNLYVQGIPGTGKSTLLKYLMVLEYALFNTQQVIWDAECEYLDLAKHSWINGEIIDCASGSTGRINPLQIRYTPRVTESDLEDGEDISEYMVYEESVEGSFSDMALHIQNLRQFFSIYFG